MDLNTAFAKHWDKKNPSDFVRACDHSRELREDYERRKKNLDYLDRLAQECALNKGCTAQSETKIKSDV
jgi:hypothetical protein